MIESILSDLSLWLTFHFEWHSIFMTFHFEWHSMLSDIPLWVTFHFEWHSILSDIPFWLTFHFYLHSILRGIPFSVTLNFNWHFFSDIPFWVTFYFKWHSNFSDIPFWVTFLIEWHSIMSDWLVSQSRWWELRWYRTINFQSLCQWVSESAFSRSRAASESKNLTSWSIGFPKISSLMFFSPEYFIIFHNIS